VLTLLTAGTGSLSAAGIFNHADEPFTHIIVGPQEPPSVQLAAQELRKYLRAVCDTNLPIVAEKQDGLPILVGASDELTKRRLSGEELKGDEFRIVANDQGLAIFGKDYRGRLIVGHRTPHTAVYNTQLKLPALGSVGTLFGVYRFLEKYAGVRWYMPGEVGTVVPKRDRIVLPKLDESDRPHFHYRFIRLAVQIIKNPELALWYRQLGFGASPNVEINHSFRLMRKYIKTNPEFFALVDGERDFTNKCATQGGGPQLCLTNPDVAEQWAKDIVEFFSKQPWQDCYAIVPGDGLKRVCECPTCDAEVLKDGPKEKMYSNHIWGFINRIAEKVAKTYPDKFIGGLAYERYRMPPDFDVHPNAVMMFCKRRSALVDPEYRDRIRGYVNGWRKRTSKIYFWVYYLDHWMPWRNLPFAFPHVIQEDLKYMKQIGSGGESIEAEEHPAVDQHHLNYPGMQHLNLYVTAKLQWHPDLDLDALLEEYYTLFYGPARDEMRSFWQFVEKNYADRTIARRQRAVAAQGNAPPQVHRPRVSPVNVFPPSVLDRLDSLLTAALAKTEPESIYAKRIRIIKGEFDKGRARLLAEVQAKATRLVLPGPATVTGGTVPYSRPARFRDNLDHVESPAASRTEAALAWDRQYLYLRFVCYEDRMQAIKKKCTTRDDNGLWRDDCIEVFISPDPGNPKLCYQVIVNAAGAVWDGKYQDRGAPDVDWNAGIEVEKSALLDRWTVSLKVRLRDLGLDGNTLAGREIGCNIYRNRQSVSPTEYTAWSPTGVVDHYSPERFGRIVFRPRE